MTGLVISDAYAAPIIAAIVIGLLSWMAYISRTVAVLSRLLDETAQTVAASAETIATLQHEQSQTRSQVARQQGFLDGLAFARAQQQHVDLTAAERAERERGVV